MNRHRNEATNAKVSRLDRIDLALARALAANGRATMAELARSVGLSPPSVAERVRRLEDQGVITGYAAAIDPVVLGLGIAAYIRVRPQPGLLRKVADVIAGLSAVVACDRVTGEDCFIAKVNVRSVEELETVIDEIMPYAMTNTSIIQSSPVRSRLPALPGEAP